MLLMHAIDLFRLLPDWNLIFENPTWTQRRLVLEFVQHRAPKHPPASHHMTVNKLFMDNPVKRPLSRPNRDITMGLRPGGSGWTSIGFVVSAANQWRGGEKQSCGS